MKLKVKSNGNIVEMPTKVYNELPVDQRLAYHVISKEDSPEPKEQVVSNKAADKKPETGEKK